MRCLQCQRKGSHFQRKICPQCTAAGVTRADIHIQRQTVLITTLDIPEREVDVREALDEVRSTGRHYSNVSRRFVPMRAFGQSAVELSYNEITPKETA